MFEHALSEDSVMNHFRSVVSKCKKFAKPELKVCIEEFEEKLCKVHQEKKEQETTTKNAEAHRQRIGSLDEFFVTREVGQNSGNSAEEETSEAVDPSVDSNTEDKENTPECRDNICAENCQTSTTCTEPEDDSAEVQSAQNVRKGLSRSRVKKIRNPVLEDSADSAPVRRVARSSRRQGRCKGFRCIRMVNNIHLNFDALHGDKDHGGVHDGTTVVLWEWAKGPNQSWKILPWGDEAYAPPPAYGYPGCSQAGAYPPSPPAQEPGYGYRPPPGGYAPPPAQEPCYGYGPPPPSAGYGYSNLPRALASESTVRIYCKADDGYSLTVRNDTVCLAPTNPRDDFQHWVKDMRHSTSIKDEEGYPAFALVNKVTGEAIKHSMGQSHPVRLVPYNADYVDESVLWTESRDVGHGFRCIRMVNNIYLNFDAFHGDKAHGGVHDGTTVVLWEWAKGDNQRWKIAPW